MQAASAAQSAQANEGRVIARPQGYTAKSGAARGPGPPGRRPSPPSEHRHGEERPEVVVGYAQPCRQEPHDRPEHLVGDVPVEVEQQLEVGPRERDQGTACVGNRVGGALGAVEDRHLAEAGARLEDGERFFARAGYGARDAHLAFGDDEQAVAGLAFLEDVVADGELVLAAHLSHPGELSVIEVLEDRRLLQQIEIHGVKLCGAGGPAAPDRDRRRPDARHRGGARVPRCLDRATPGDAAGAGRRQGRHRVPVAHARGVHRGLAVGTPARLGHRGDRPVRHLGLRPRSHARRSVRHPRSQRGAGGGRDVVRGTAWVATWLVLSAAGLAAQEFHPPPVKQAAGRGTRIGLFGFSVRSGPDVSHGSQLVLGAGLDGGDLFSRRLRLRPSVEIGVFNGPNTYVTSLEALYRFTADDEPGVPYAGGGLSIAGHDGCGADAACPAVWANVVVGFELRYRSTFNWLFEYHAMDAFRRHRFYFGLTTRRGN